MRGERWEGDPEESDLLPFFLALSLSVGDSCMEEKYHFGGSVKEISYMKAIIADDDDFWTLESLMNRQGLNFPRAGLCISAFNVINSVWVP